MRKGEKFNGILRDELLDGEGKMGYVYGNKSSDTGKELLSSGIGIQSIYVLLQTKEGKEGKEVF